MSAFESSQIHAKVQQALFRRMLAVNRLVPNGVESPGVGSAQNLKDSLATGQAFLPQDIVGDKNPYEQQIIRSAFCKVSADVLVGKDIMTFSSYITGGPGGKGEATQANRPISFKDKINPDSNSYRGDTGVQSVSIAQKSYFMNEITINWVCPDPMDFESRIQPIFLIHGRMIFVEFGFGINSSKEFEQLSQIGTKTLKKLDREILLLNSAHPDKYQVFRGLVTKYDFKITDYGGYSGTITLASKGKNVLETPIQKATQQTSTSTSTELGVNDYKNKLKEKIEKENKTIDDQGEDFIGPQKSTEKELKDKFSDTEVHFKAVIEALPEVVDRYVKEAPPKGVSITEDNKGRKDAVIPPVRKLNYYYKNGAMNYFFGAGVDINPDDDTWFGPVVTKLYEEVKQAGGELVDSEETWWKRTWGGVKLLGAAALAVAGAVGSGVVATGVAVVATGAAVVGAGRALLKVGKMATEELFESEINDKQEKSTHLVTWGWFEHHILNSFFQVQSSTNTGEGTQTLQQIRSVHLPYNYEVEQYNTEEGKKESQSNRQTKSYNEALKVERESQEEGNEASTEEEFQNVQRLIEANDKMSVVSDSKYLVSNRCANSPSLQSIGLDSVVIPGQTNKFWEEEVVSGSQAEPIPDQQLDAGQAVVAIGTTVATAAGLANPFTLAPAAAYLFKKRSQNIDQQVVRKLYGVINEEFPSFKVDDSLESGYIRNLVFDVKYLQDSFKDITNLKQGLRDFWSKVKTDMFDYNGFQITQDLSDDGRVGITDTKYQNPIENAKDLLSSKKQSQAEEFADEKALSNKMFFLPVYTKSSIVRSFSVGLKLTDKAASMAALGSNIGTDGKSPTYHYDVGIESFAQATALQSGPDKSVNKETADTYNLTKEQVEREQKLKNLVVNDLHTFVGGTDKIGSSAVTEHGNNSGKTGDITDNSGVDFSGVSEVLKNIDDINNELENLEDTKNKDGGKDSKETLGSIYDNKGRMKKRPKELISSTINKSLGPNPNQEGHYNLNKTIIPIELSLTLDGIGGLRVGNMFKTDYLPELYRKYSYFTITEVSHAVGIGGWTTDITAMMKLDRVKMIEDGLITKRGGNVSTKASNEELLQNAQDAGRDYYFNNEGKYTVIQKPTDEPDKTAEEKELIQPVEETITRTEPTINRTDGVRLKSGKVLYPRDEGYEEANIVKKREFDKKRKDEIPSIVPDPTQPSSYNTKG